VSANSLLRVDCQRAQTIDMIAKGCRSWAVGKTLAKSCMVALGKALIFVGLLIAVCGVGLWALCNLNPSLPILGRIGRLPGDIYIKRGNFTFYFPLMTSIIVSIVLTIIFALLRR
jgi:Protein of unknown function (DUF2905)